jgi:hypothetical protein
MRLLLLAVAFSVALPGNALVLLDAPPEAPGAGLSAALQAAGLERPEETLEVLRKLSLPTVADLHLLDLEEGAELRAELKIAAVALGDRARLRARLWQPGFQSSFHSNGGTEPTEDYVSRENCLPRAAAARREAPRRQLQQVESPESPEKAKDDATVGGETLALMLTALLGIGSFVIQARVSKAADVNQREIEHQQEQFGA